MPAGGHHRDMGGAAMMFLSAAIFAFFGFYYVSFPYTTASGQFLFFVALLDWTIKVSAVAFAVCGLITLAKPLVGNLLYAIVGLLGAIAFVLVAVLDWLDKDHVAFHPVFILLFAAWNGFGAASTLRELARARSERAPGGGLTGEAQ